ncbi:MAG: hypothetical protein RDU13_09565 [Elusimicrobiales bacterium]|jgi:hypothetical protein|nr:hypothetical protein [Elusimicrobiales bacterium]
MIKKALLISAAAAIPFSAPDASAFDLVSMDLETVRALPAAPAPSAEAKNYYLVPDSYDPLLDGAGRDGEKINIIGGTIDIPGMDGTLDFARRYRQAAYARHDLQSDVALTVYTKNLPKVLFQVIFGIAEDNGDANGGTYSEHNPVIQDPPMAAPTEADIMALDIPEDEKQRLLVQLRNSRLHLEGRINPFRRKEIIKMYQQIIVEERANGIEPRFGEPHEWSPEFRRYCRDKGEMIPQVFTKLLTALASGVTSRHFKTGTEAALIDHILTLADGSFTMDQAFRQSYRLNRGDVYLTILTIENVLSDHWRHPEREKLAVTRKLANISNFYQGKGDKFGAWYHYHGIMLYGYVRGGFRAALVGGIETMGSHVLNSAHDQGDEQQEDYVNSTGGKIGARLAKVIREKAYDTFVADRNYCDPAVYLDLSEDWRDRIEFVESKDFKATLDDARMWLKPLYRDYYDCRVEIIYNDHTGRLNSKYIVKRDNVDFKKGKSKPILINPLHELVTARAFISGCLASETPVGTKSLGGVPARGVWVDPD